MTAGDPAGRGLSAAEAAARLAADGPNLLPGAQSRNTLAIALEVLREPMFLLLVASAGIYQNIRNAMRYILAVHVPTAGMAFIPLLMGQPPRDPAEPLFNLNMLLVSFALGLSALAAVVLVYGWARRCFALRRWPRPTCWWPSARASSE